MRRATGGGDLTCPHAKQASECLYSAYFLRVPTIFGKEDCDRPKRTPGGLGGLMDTGCNISPAGHNAKVALA